MAISNLEAEFSSKFFIRTSKGLVLTPDGEYFREWSLNILANLKECWEHFEGRDAQQGVIKCAGAQGVVCEFAAALISKFESTYQGYSVYLREYKDRICDTVVENKEADIGFGVGPIDTDKFECHRIFQSKLVCLLPDGHEWTKYDKIPIKILPEERFITVDEQFKSADYFLEQCARLGVVIKPKLRVGEITAVHRLVREHMGVGLTVETVANALSTPDTVYREFDGDDFLWPIDIFKKKNAALPQCARIFFEYVQRQAAIDNREKIAPARLMEQPFT